MGACYINPFDLVDYMNQFTSQKVPDFSSAVEFFIAPEFTLSEDFNFKIEYSYLLKTHTLGTAASGTYQFDYTVHMPTAMLVYVIEGEGFNVKLGGGVGYYFGKTSILFPNSATESRYKGEGVGVKLELVGNTAFGETFYGIIGADLRLGFIGGLRGAAGQSLTIGSPPRDAKPVRLHFASAGIKFGVAYYF